MLDKITCMGFFLAALRSMVWAAYICIQQSSCTGNVLYSRSVSFLDITPFQFILFSMGHTVLQYCTRKSAVALRDFSSNPCAKCFCSALYSRDSFSGFGSGSYSWIAAVRFFLGDASFCRAALWDAQALSTPGESFNCQFITSSRSFVLLGNRLHSGFDCRTSARGFFFTAEADIAGHAV